MVKFLDILLESIEESKPITLDKSVFTQIDKIYDKFTNLDHKNIVQNLEERGALFLGYIEFKNPYTSKPEKIEVWLYNTSRDGADAAYVLGDRSIEVYYAALKNANRKNFVNAIYHELIHSVDPKISNIDLFSKILSKKDYSKDASSEYIKYIKDPHELDAFSSSFINQLSKDMEGLDEKDLKDAKSILKKIINGLLSLLKEFPNANLKDDTIKLLGFSFLLNNTKDIDTLANKYGLLDIDSFKDFISNIIFYFNKPSLFKKYIQRLSTLL